MLKTMTAMVVAAFLGSGCQAISMAAAPYSPPVAYENPDDIHASQGRIYAENIPGVTPAQGEAYSWAQAALLPLIDAVYAAAPGHYRSVGSSSDMTKPFTATFYFAGEPPAEAVALVEGAGFVVVTGLLMSMDEMRELQRHVVVASAVIGHVDAMFIGTEPHGDVMIIQVNLAAGDDRPLAELEAAIVAAVSQSYDGPFDLNAVIDVVPTDGKIIFG